MWGQHDSVAVEQTDLQPRQSARVAAVVVLGGFMEAFIRSLNILCAS